MSRVFINYRRADASAHANLLYDWMRERYGEDRVFKDVDTIEPGLDFAEAIDRAVAQSEVMLVVIGREWIVDEKGRRRLEDADDYVCMEVATALERNIRVIPVLVEGAEMPRADQLPQVLSALPRRQAFELSDARSRVDRAELVARLDRILGGPGQPATNGGSGQPVTRPPVTVPVPAEPETTQEPADRTKKLVMWGWILAGASLFIPFAAAVSIILGAMVISRSGGKRTGMGIGIIVTAIVVGFISLSIWINA